MKKILYLPLLILTLLTPIAPLLARMLSQEISDREGKKKKKKIKLKDRDGNTISTMSYEDLKKNKDNLLTYGDDYTAAKYVEEMVRVCEDHAEKQDLMLELGDIWYEQKNYKLAQRVYEDFEMLYPGSEHVAFALSREIECSYAQINSADRDQSSTEDTLKLCQRFMDRKDAFIEFVPTVLEIEKQAWQRLFESEMYVANFYLNGSHFKAAEKRLETLKQRFEKTSLVVEPAVLECKIRVAQAQNNLLDATKLQIELAENYPQEKVAAPFVAALPELKVTLVKAEQVAPIKSTTTEVNAVT